MNTMNCIRIKTEEYDEIPRSGPYTHFNLGVANHVAGTIYALPQIMKGGYQTKTRIVEPILSYKDILCAQCVDVRVCSFDDVTDYDLKYAMLGIRTVNDLKQRILARYMSSRPEMTKEDILNSDITVTYLVVNLQG